MLLYLTSNQKSNLIDPAVRNMTLPAKKLVGRFSLKSFVTKDMRNYANAKFFVVDAACIEESGNDFTLALQSFQMMFSARIIVILSGCEDVNGEVQRLLSIGVVNLVIIYDCGVMQTPTSIFRDAEHRLLCGSLLPYEIPVFHKALSECGSLEVRPVAICVPQEIQEYCTELFGEDVQIAAASHDLFAKQVNGQIYRPLVEKYIAGEKRL